MLKPRKRITKKQLKEDKLVTFYFKATDWLERNTNFILYGVAAVLVIIAAFTYYAYSSNKAEKEASVEFAKATRTFESFDYQNAIAQFSNLVDNYGSTTSGKLGRFYLANCFYQTKDYANAEKNYKKFISNFSGGEHFLAAAQGGIAASLAQRQIYAEAAKAFEKAAHKYESVLTPNYLLQAAQCFSQSSNNVKAKELYNEIITKYPKSPEKDDALMLVSMLSM